MFELSICIPTYNRAEFLKEAIESVLLQLDDDTYSKVEIVISDNCSTDNTVGIIELLRNKYPKSNIVFSACDMNQGPDRNFLRAIKLSSGKYCWFLGSDDKVVDGAVDRILNEIKNGHTVYLSDRYNAECETMNIIGIQRFWGEELISDCVFTFRNEKDWDFYLNRCKALGALFSYISTIVFCKYQWDQIPETKYSSFIGTAYVHVAVLLEILKNNKESSLKYLCSPIAINRTGNDSFMETRYQRTMLDINGYIMLSDLFDDSNYTRIGIRNVLKREYQIISWGLIITTKNSEFSDLIKKLKLIGYPNKELSHFIMLRKHRILSLCIYVLDTFSKRIKRKNDDSV